jgi:hypothetical protein
LGRHIAQSNSVETTTLCQLDRRINDASSPFFFSELQL